MTLFHFVLLQLPCATVEALTDPELLNALKMASSKRTHTVPASRAAGWEKPMKSCTTLAETSWISSGYVKINHLYDKIWALNVVSEKTCARLNAWRLVE